jgi:hypothetical protein
VLSLATVPKPALRYTSQTRASCFSECGKLDLTQALLFLSINGDAWRDGAHRVACAAVLGLKVQVLYLKVQYPIRQWGVDWFVANGFSRKYVNGLLESPERYHGILHWGG